MEREIERIEPDVLRDERHWITPEGEVSAIVRWTLERMVIGYGVPAVLVYVAEGWPAGKVWCLVVFALVFGLLAVVHVRAWRDGNGWSALSGLLIALGAIVYRFQQ